MKNDLAELLPDRPIDENFDKIELLKATVREEEKRLNRKLNSAEINRIKYRELRAAKNEQIYDGHEYKSDFMAQDIEVRAEKRAEAIEKANRPVVFVAKEDKALVGSSSREINKLLASLNVNLNVQLTKNDTHNLLATLLTCNEKQLNALLVHPKVPLAIRAVIKRIIDDASQGNIAVIERLWDRIFGTNKVGGIMEATAGNYEGILPNVPVSREAYILIRETLIGKA